MKIAFISQWYDPEVGSAAIPGSIVRALAARGHSVTVVTGFPNYPTGRIYDGYRVRLLQREQRGDTEVLRIPMYPAHGRSGLKRAMFFLSFMLSAATWGAWLSRRADAVVIYSTSSTVGLAGVVLGRVFRMPVTLFVEDLWPDSVMASGMVRGPLGRFAWWSLTKLSKLGYDAADRIAVISPGMRGVLIDRGVSSDKIDVVHNWVDEDVFAPAPSSAPEQTFDVMYAGNLGDVQGLDVAIRGLALLQDRPEIRIRFVGAGVAEESLRALATDLDVAERVVWEGSKPLTDMSAVLASAHVQLVCLRDLPLFKATMPSKTQAILACGLPVVVSAPGDVAALVSRSGAGEAVPPEDAQALADAIRRLAELDPEQLADLGNAGRDFYQSELSARVGAERLESTIMRAVGSEVA